MRPEEKLLSFASKGTLGFAASDTGAKRSQIFIRVSPFETGLSINRLAKQTAALEPNCLLPKAFGSLCSYSTIYIDQSSLPSGEITKNTPWLVDGSLVCPLQ